MVDRGKNKSKKDTIKDLDFIIDKEKFVNEIYPAMCPGKKYMPSIMEAVSRVVVFGDIHGDYKLTIEMLQVAKLIVMNLEGKILWSGGDTYVVQVGDQVDRCRPMANMVCKNPGTTPNDEASDVKIMELFNSLHEQAVKVGGAVISLLGNHELMNAMGRLTYVSHLGLKEFENYVDPDNPNVKFESGEDGRAYAFSPGKQYGKMMGCSRYPAVIVGKHLFVHAGIIDALIEEIGLNDRTDIETVNVAVRMWLLGLLGGEHVKNIVETSETSMFWTRILGNIPPNVALENPVCYKHLDKVLDLFKVGSIVIGHTPQSFTYADDINQTCSGRVWRVDNGSSGAFDRFDPEFVSKGKSTYSRRTQVLEIIDDREYFIYDRCGRKKIEVDESSSERCSVSH